MEDAGSNRGFEASNVSPGLETVFLSLPLPVHLLIDDSVSVQAVANQGYANQENKNPTTSLNFHCHMIVLSRLFQRLKAHS